LFPNREARALGTAQWVVSQGVSRGVAKMKDAKDAQKGAQMREVGKRLTALREAYGYSQRKIGGMVGVSSQALP
jgi:hypothetical protein